MSELWDDGGTRSRDANAGKLSSRKKSSGKRLAISPPQEPFCTRKIEVDGRKKMEKKGSE